MGSTTAGAVAAAPAGVRRRVGELAARLRRPDPVTCAVLLVVAVAAVWLLAAYRDNMRVRWSSIYHDRNAHYLAGLNPAADLRHGHVGRALAALDAASMVWPAFQPVLQTLVLTVAGPNPVAAVAPSLLGWCAATVLAFLIARRLGGDYGAAGAAVTAALFLTGPMMRAYAADVMLESLGLTLTLAVVYAYLRFAECPSKLTGTALGVVLTCLFLQKYNYWMLAAAVLVVAEVVRRPRAAAVFLRDAAYAVGWPEWAPTQLRRPLNYVIVVLFALGAMAAANGGVWVEVGDKNYGFRQPRVVVNVAYALLVLRLLVWWRDPGRGVIERLCGEGGARLVAWAVIPPALWLTLPFRLQLFVYYTSPTTRHGGIPRTVAESVRYYIDGFANYYHLEPWMAAAAALLAAVGLIGLLARRNAPTGWAAVPLTVLVAGTLAVLHKHQLVRFLHTWAPALWVLTGVGVAALAGAVARVAGARAAQVLAGAAVAAALAVLAPGALREGRTEERGHGVPAVSLRDLYDAYLPLIDGTQPTAVFGSLPGTHTQWAFIERFGHRDGLTKDMRSVGVYDTFTDDAAARWVQLTDCRQVVYVEIPPTSPLFEAVPGTPDNSALPRAMAAQTRFAPTACVPVGDLGTVYVWKR
jgi:hypothetical protein